MKTASAISAGLHAAVLLWATLTFTGETFKVTPAQSLPVDLISEKDFSEITKGVKDAPKPVEEPKPLVEKVEPKEEPKPVEEAAPKITEKKEVEATKHEAQPQPEQESDPIAEKLKEQPEKQEARIEPTRMPPRRPPRPRTPERKFEPNKIAALLNKRDPQRNAAIGDTLNSTRSLGTAAATSAAQLSQSEIDALRARLNALWNPPVGMRDGDRLQITIRIRFRRDGTLADGPQVLTSGTGVRYNAMRDSAVRAVLTGQPYTMLRPEHYDAWKEIDFTFDTQAMYRDISLQ
jgi:outer membrane biosynthesis protein TonB